jgi:hypothetical protein
MTTRPEIRHGTLEVPAADNALYQEAKTYLTRDGVEKRLFSRLEHSLDGRRYRITINHRDNDCFDPNNDTIAWDPYSALRTSRGGHQSPALGLGHEIDHAVERPATEEQLNDRCDRRYDTAEERRVITGSEAHAARTLGESVRHDHGGTTYRVASPVVR